MRIGAIAILVAGGIASGAAPAQDPAKAEAGERVYNNYCFTCHGEELRSSGQTFDLRRLKPDERPRFEQSVLNGKGQMPPWKGVLSEAEIDQLWHYIRTHATAR